MMKIMMKLINSSNDFQVPASNTMHLILLYSKYVFECRNSTNFCYNDAS